MPKSNKRERSPIDVDENDSEDELLAEAAAQWASKDTADTLLASHTTTSSVSSNKPLSVHVTQLSFQATDYDVRTAFVQQGCAVSSIRLVYDGDGHHKTFRGVAFIDVLDEVSYKKALQLDRTVLLGRRINVRPTKSKDELANIVQRTKVLVADKIRKERQEHAESSDGVDANKRPKSNSDKHDKKKHKADSKGGAHKKQGAANKHKSPVKHGGEKKLTKKERNRKAAIIMSRKRGKR